MFVLLINGLEWLQFVAMYVYMDGLFSLQHPYKESASALSSTILLWIFNQLSSYHLLYMYASHPPWSPRSTSSSWGRVHSTKLTTGQQTWQICFQDTAPTMNWGLSVFNNPSLCWSTCILELVWFLNLLFSCTRREERWGKKKEINFYRTSINYCLSVCTVWRVVLAGNQFGAWRLRQECTILFPPNLIS